MLAYTPGHSGMQQCNSWAKRHDFAVIGIAWPVCVVWPALTRDGGWAPASHVYSCAVMVAERGAVPHKKRTCDTLPNLR